MKEQSDSQLKLQRGVNPINYKGLPRVRGFQKMSVTNRVPDKDAESQNGVMLARSGPAAYPRRHCLVQLHKHDERDTPIRAENAQPRGETVYALACDLVVAGGHVVRPHEFSIEARGVQVVIETRSPFQLRQVKLSPRDERRQASFHTSAESRPTGA